MTRFALREPAQTVRLPQKSFTERAIVDPAKLGVASLRLNTAFDALMRETRPDQRTPGEQFGSQAAGAVPPPRGPDPARVARARQEYLDAVDALHSMDVNPVVGRAMSDPSGRAFWAEFKENPAELTSALFLQSAPAMLPALGAAIAGGVVGGPAGAATGAGLGSFAVEQSASFVESFARQGVDMRDPEALQAAMQDPQILQRARAYSATRGLAVATFDALTAGIASKTIAPLRGATPLRRQLQNVPAQMVAQPVGGAAGEASAQALTNRGGIESIPEIAAEAVAEIPGAPFEVASIRGALAASGRSQPQAGPRRRVRIPTTRKLQQGTPGIEPEIVFPGTPKAQRGSLAPPATPVEQAPLEVEGFSMVETPEGKFQPPEQPGQLLSKRGEPIETSPEAVRALTEARGQFPQAIVSTQVPELRQTLSALQQAGATFQVPPRPTFRVPLEQTLNLDLPLAEQSPEVQTAVRQVIPEALDSASGRDIQQAAIRRFGPEVAPLREAGVAGVRFGQQGSREVVLFDPEAAVLESVDGRPVPQLEGAPAEVRAQIAQERANVGLPPAGTLPAVKGASKPPSKPPSINTTVPPPKSPIAGPPPEAIPPRFREDVRRWTSLTKWGWTLLQIFERNRDIPQIAQYVEEQLGAHNLATRWQERAIVTYKAWRSLGFKRAQRVGEYMLALTMHGGRPTPEQEAAIQAEHQMDDDMLVVADQITKDFDDFIVAQRDAAIYNVGATISDPDLAAAEITRINEQFEQLRNRPYFPLARFGRHAIVVKTQQDRTVEGVPRKTGQVSHMFLYESARERNRELKRIQRELPERDGWSVSTDTITDAALHWQGLPPPILDTIKDLPGMDEKLRGELDRLAVVWAPSEAWRKRMLRRKRTAGYSTDAMRAFSQYFFKGSTHLARVRHLGDAQRALNRFTRFVNKVEGPRKHELRNIQQWLQDHLEYTTRPPEEWTWLRNIMFHWFLGFSPASAVVNLTQPFMVTGPFLAARFGDVATMREFTKAYKDVGKAFWEGKRLARDEQQLIQWGVETGFIDESQATELGGFSRAGLLSRRMGGTVGQQMVIKGQQISGYLFQAAERINRRQTTLASYRLALQQPNQTEVREIADAFPHQVRELKRRGLSDREARAAVFARWGVWKTQYEYTRYNRPSFMRGPVKSNVFVFMQYLQNTLWFARHDPGAWRFLGALFALGGMMGMPGAEDLTEIAKAMMRLGGKPEWARDVRKAVAELAETIGVEPDLALHGVSRYTTGLPQAFGRSSWPVPGVDLSGRLSLGRIVPGLAPAAQSVGKPGGEWDFGSDFMRTTTDVAGAAISPVMGILQGVLSNNPDTFKRWERALPASVKNAWQGVEGLQGKPERTRNREPVVPFDPEDPHHNFEAVMRMMGFRPQRSSKAWDLRTTQTEAARYYTGYRTNLLRALDHARQSGDREGVADAMREIREWNREIPRIDPGLAISSRDIRQSLEGRMKRRLRSELGLPQSSRTQKLFRDIAKERGHRSAPEGRFKLKTP